MYVVQLVALEPAHRESRLDHEPVRHNYDACEFSSVAGSFLIALSISSPTQTPERFQTR